MPGSINLILSINLVIVHLIQEGLSIPATGWPLNSSYTFNIPSRKEYTGRALSELVSVVTWNSQSQFLLQGCTQHQAPKHSGPKHGLSVLPEQQLVQIFIFPDLLCITHIPARLQHGNSTRSPKVESITLTECLFSFVPQTQPLYCQGGASEGPHK